MEKCGCISGNDNNNADAADWFPDDDYVDQNLNEQACEGAGGTWDCFKWDGEEPECVDSYWTKVSYTDSLYSSFHSLSISLSLSPFYWVSIVAAPHFNWFLLAKSHCSFFV